MRGDAVIEAADHRDGCERPRPWREPARQWPRTIRHRHRTAPCCPCPCLREHARLHGGIVFHRAMAVEMVRRDVGEDADVGLQPRHQVDLEGGKLQHIDAALRRLAQQEHRLADVAAHIDVEPRLRQHMADQRRRRRLAVGAGDGDDARTRGLRPRARRSRCRRSPRSRHARAFSTVQCGSGWVSGTPGLSTSASSVAKSSSWRLATGSPAARAFSTAGAESSQANTSAPPSRNASIRPCRSAPARTRRRACP